MMKYVLLLTAAGFQAAAGFQLAPTRMRAVHVLRAADSAEAIESATKKLVDKRDITVPEVQRTGNYKVQVKLHPEVVAEINLEVISH